MTIGRIFEYLGFFLLGVGFMNAVWIWQVNKIFRRLWKALGVTEQEIDDATS